MKIISKLYILIKCTGSNAIGIILLIINSSISDSENS